MPATTPARRAGGRSAKVQDAVYTAVGQVMGEGKADRITIPLLAGRAGVNPTSIYRRWGDLDTLLEEVAVAALTRDGDEPPNTGSLRDDLSTWARIVVDDITQLRRTRYLRAMTSARDEVLTCPCWEQRRGQAKVMLDRARARGERAPSEQQVLDHVIAPMYHHVVFGLPVDRDYADQLVHDVLAMA